MSDIVDGSGPNGTLFTARRLRILAGALIAAALFVFAREFHEQGHGWGDDYALYINQARGLAEGTAGDVVADTRFALDNSAYSSFSPSAYPWLFPLLLMPIVVRNGVDYDALKLIPTLSFVGAILLLHHLVAPRLSRVEALAVATFFALNVWYVGRTDQVLSDLPFWFLLLLSLVAIDRLALTDRLLDDWRATVWTGIAVLAAFNVRREGIVLLAAIGAAQAVALIRSQPTWRSRLAAVATRRSALVAPYAAFALGAIAIQVARPAPFQTSSEDAGESGLQHVRFNAEWYRDPLAEYLNLKDIGPNDISLFGSEALGQVAFWVLVGLAVVGIVAALVRDARRDVHLVAALVLVALAVLVQPFRESRYLLSLVPLLVYFTVRGARSVVAVVLRGHGPRIVPMLLPTLLLLGPFLSGVTDTRHALDYHRTYDYIHWGPASPESVELFDAVERYTDGRDVVVFFQARTMNLETRRLSIQGNNVEMMVQRGDWYAMVRDSDYIQTPLTDEQAAELGFVKVWENAAYVLWRIPDPPAPPPCC